MKGEQLDARRGTADFEVIQAMVIPGKVSLHEAAAKLMRARDHLGDVVAVRDTGLTSPQARARWSGRSLACR